VPAFRPAGERREGGGARARLAEIPGLVPQLDQLPPGCRFQERCERVAERCRTEEPVLAPIGADRLVRCHFPIEGR
jgi:oligopeptide/dipeptide ABC transporter ATP-binding protein